MRWGLILAVMMMVGSVGVRVGAQVLDEMAVQAREDLKQALGELTALREKVEAERLPLARRVNELENEVLAQRQAYDRAQREADNRLVSLGELRKEVDRSRTEAKFLSALLSEYVSRFETRIHVVELEQFQEAIGAAKVAGSQEDLTPPERLAKQATLLDVSLARLESNLGGNRFEGAALTPEGRLERGRYALLGPTAFFASQESEAAGVAELRLGSPRPRAIAIGQRLEEAIRVVVNDGEGMAPVDATLGNALKIAEKQDSIVAHVMKGGPVMIPILLLGLSAVVICLLKWLQLSKVKTASPMDLQAILRHLRKGETGEAANLAKRLAGPVGDLLTVAVEHAKEQKEYLEEVLYEKMLEARPRLERLLPIIALTAATAPLLGLLGTVTGMINTFNMITLFGAGDPRTLSGGISEALITTEFGLIVAIPALLMHAFISRKVKGVLGSMEQTSVAFINGVPEPQN